jgi:hypothetical protein
MINLPRKVVVKLGLPIETKITTSSKLNVVWSKSKPSQN